MGSYYEAEENPDCPVHSKFPQYFDNQEDWNANAAEEQRVHDWRRANFDLKDDYEQF